MVMDYNLTTSYSITYYMSYSQLKEIINIV